MGRFEVATTPPPLGVVLNDDIEDEGNNEDVCWKVVVGLLHGK
jgi:hypothetical protein